MLAALAGTGRSGWHGARAAMMPCNPHAATTLLPTMSPFMRAGMKCEGLGINSATELWPCRGPVPLSEAQMDRGARQVTQGAVWVSTRHFRLLCVCHCSSLLAGAPQTDRQTPLVAWHLPAFASEPLIQSWCPSALSHTTGTAPAAHAKRESLFTSWTAKPVQATSLAPSIHSVLEGEEEQSQRSLHRAEPWSPASLEVPVFQTGAL